MPSFPAIQEAANGFHYVHWTEPGKPGKRGRSKKVSLGTKDPVEAQTRFGRWLLTAHDVPTDASTVTVVELWDAYVAGHEVVEEASRRSIWKNLGPVFAALKLSDVSYEKGRQYHQARSTKGAADSSVRRELGALLACFNWCADKRRKIIPKTAVPEFDLPPDSEPRDRWLTTEEIDKLFAAARDMRAGDRMSRLERFMWLALETGARRTAIMQLTWDRVDFETGVIHYDVPGRKKTKKRRASVPISTRLRPVLDQMLAEREGELVMDNGVDLWATMQWAVRRAGLADSDVAAKPCQTMASGVSPHTLRHTAATHMARRGVPLWIIAKILGNTLAMVEKVYAKHCPEDLREAVNLISGAHNLGAKQPKT